MSPSNSDEKHERCKLGIYEELYEIWRAEISTEDLIRISAEFFDRLSEYFQRLNDRLRSCEREDVKDVLTMLFENAKYMVREMLMIRLFKALRRALEEKEDESLQGFIERRLSGYEEYIKKAIEAAKLLRQSLRGLLERRTPEPGLASPPINLKEGYAVVRLLRDLPKIVGIDLKVYGPFAKEDLAVLPVENANALASKGVAEIIFS